MAQSHGSSFELELCKNTNTSARFPHSMIPPANSSLNTKYKCKYNYNHFLIKANAVIAPTHKSSFELEFYETFSTNVSELPSRYS